MIHKNAFAHYTIIMIALGMTGSSATADAPNDSFSGGYIRPIVINYSVAPTPFIETPYGNSGPLAEIALEYDKQIELQNASYKAISEEKSLLRMQEEAEKDLFIRKQEDVDSLIHQLFEQVGVAPYGFGDTPARWDCSGLTKWYLENLGFEDVPHSATAQVNDERFEIVDAPISGDLVAFQRHGASSTYFHIGVYVGGGYMIHAANPSKDTAFQTTASFAEAENSRVVYLRF